MTAPTVSPQLEQRLLTSFKQAHGATALSFAEAYLALMDELEQRKRWFDFVLWGAITQVALDPGEAILQWYPLDRAR